jgi:signal transduction histidine kinase
MSDDILHRLRERVKELTALHKTARIIQDETRSVESVLEEVVSLLPPAWQYPEITSAKIRLGKWEMATPEFKDTEWKQEASFKTRGGAEGFIQVVYNKPCPPAFEGPFLKEERDLIDSLAEMMRSYLQHKLADDALQKAHDDLENQVKVRTRALEKANLALQEQVSEYKKAEQRIENYQRQLRRLASELSLAEARERRAIAEDLHDHIGQALAIIKMDMGLFRGNAIFCGFDDKIDEINALIEQTIQYTRNLTFEISPPSLYELGLMAAIEGLIERFRKKYKIDIKLVSSQDIGRFGNNIEILVFKSVQELLINIAKHAEARHVTVRLGRDRNIIITEVEDDGRGFNVDIMKKEYDNNSKFGLFNIKERFNLLGGSAEIISTPGKGTKIKIQAPVKGQELPS